MGADRWIRRASGLLVPNMNFGAVRPCPGCCNPADVLIWSRSIYVGGIDDLIYLYEGMGLIVGSYSTGWTGNIYDYSLVIWLVAESDPAWWPDIISGDWEGRFHMTADNDVFTQDSIDYVNLKSGLTGISIVGDNIDLCSTPVEDNTEDEDLTEGIADMQYGNTSQTSGGTVLARTETGDYPWLARNKVDGVDWVIAGDSSHAADACEFVLVENSRFFENLWTTSL